MNFHLSIKRCFLDTYWFTWLGLPTLLANGAILFVQPIRSLIGLQLIKMGKAG